MILDKIEITKLGMTGRNLSVYNAKSVMFGYIETEGRKLSQKIA